MSNELQTILVVEDSPTMCQLYTMVLGNRPHTALLFARNGIEALDRLAETAGLSLMIVDINMPRMDGLEFLRHAREELEADTIPALVISTEGEASDREAARRAGAAGYLRKPWTPDELLAAVDALTSFHGAA